MSLEETYLGYLIIILVISIFIGLPLYDRFQWLNDGELFRKTRSKPRKYYIGEEGGGMDMLGTDTSWEQTTKKGYYNALNLSKPKGRYDP